MLSLSIELDSAALARSLARIPASLDCRQGAMRSAMDKMSSVVMRWEHGRFVSASGGDGTWPDLALKTKVARVRRQMKAAGGSRRNASALYAAAQSVLPMLYDTGTLEAALFDRGANGHFVDFTEDGVSEGARGGTHPIAPISVGELAYAHHYGVPGKNIPARPVLGQIDAQVVGDLQVALNVGVSNAFADLARNAGLSAA